MTVGVATVSPFLRFGIVARLIGRAVGVTPGPGLDDFVAQIHGSGATTQPDLHRRIVEAWLEGLPLPSELAQETTGVADQRRSRG